MFKHFFRISLRNLGRNRLYSFINITGLSVGLAGFIIVLLYLNYELSYDKWDPQLERVYKISQRSDEEVYDQSAAPLARFLAQNVSDIETATRIQSAGSFEVPLTIGETTLFAKGSVEVDSLFFKVFPYKIVSGDKVNPIQKPNALVITPQLGKILFGDADPIGKTVKIFSSYENEVTAVMESAPGPSHMDVQFVWRRPYSASNTQWGNLSYSTYVLARQPLSTDKLDAAINPAFYNERLKQENLSLEEFRKAGHLAGLFTDAVGNIHNFPKHGSSNFTTVVVLVVLAFLLLIAGAINFSNLSIAASIRRSKEVGIRKSLGAGRSRLVLHFLGETGIQCMIALIAALILVQVLLPSFNQSFGTDLSLMPTGQFGSILLQLLTCLVLIVLLSGLYPAIVLSLVNTTRVLKGEYNQGTKGRRFRNALIVVQFVVAGFFVLGSLVIARQIRYMKSYDKGFSTEQVVRVEARQSSRDAKFDNTRALLLEVPGVKMVSKTTEVPGDFYNDTSSISFRFNGEPHRIKSVKVSSDYFNTLNVKLKAGRWFDERYSDQHSGAVILNETAAKKLGGETVLGKKIAYGWCDSLPMQVVGIVNDFHVMGFESSVQPVAFSIGNNSCMHQSGGGLLLKVGGNDITGTIAGLETAWKKIEPGMPVRYTFLDDNFQKLMASHFRLQKIIGIFTIAAICISIMGLFALTAYFTSQRRKEIGIRKVLGASVSDIAALLGRDFVKLVLAGIIIAIPLGYWATNKWLQTFAYRISPGWQLFAIAGSLVLLIAIVTVSLQTVRAAKANPVDSLREE